MDSRVILLALFAFVLAAQDKPPETCSISGTVVDSVTGEPLNKVELQLGIAVTVSDSKGHFEMVDLEPGTYHLIGKRNGYLESAYGARRADAEGTLLRLEAGQALAGLTLKLMPYSVIAGAIRDSGGEPLVGARVVASRKSYDRGVPRIEHYSDTETDDLGQYRMRGLPPGKYYLSARPAPDGTLKVDHSAGTTPRRLDVPTVYPGSAESELAVPVDVKAGARVGGIDITMVRARIYTIKGRLVSSAGAETGGALVTLRPHEGWLELAKPLQTTVKEPSGEFEIRGVPAGSYTLFADRGATQAAAALEVLGNTEGVTATLEASPSVMCRLVAEDSAKIPSGRKTVWLSDDWQHGGQFEFNDEPVAEANGVRIGHYVVQGINGLPLGWYAKRVHSGDSDVMAEGLTVRAGTKVEFEILLASDGGKVEGRVADANGNPVAGATVLLAPEPRLRYRSNLFKSTTTDQTGHYEFADIPPGDYKVFAWDDVEPGIWNDPGFLVECEKKGEPATVSPKSRQVVKVTEI